MIAPGNVVQHRITRRLIPKPGLSPVKGSIYPPARRQITIGKVFQTRQGFLTFVKK
jgi:hypothetical protein